MYQKVFGVLNNSLVNCPTAPVTWEALEAALLGRTSFAIAHRLTTIQGATIRATHGYLGDTDGSRTDWQLKQYVETETYKSGGLGARKAGGFKRWLQLKSWPAYLQIFSYAQNHFRSWEFFHHRLRHDLSERWWPCGWEWHAWGIDGLKGCSLALTGGGSFWGIYLVLAQKISHRCRMGMEYVPTCGGWNFMVNVG